MLSYPQRALIQAPASVATLRSVLESNMGLCGENVAKFWRIEKQLEDIKTEGSKQKNDF